MRVSPNAARVDGRVGSNLNVVFDNHDAELRYVFILTLILNVPESIASNDGPVMDDHMVAQARTSSK